MVAGEWLVRSSANPESTRLILVPLGAEVTGRMAVPLCFRLKRPSVGWCTHQDSNLKPSDP